MTERVAIGSLQIASPLYELVQNTLLPGTGLDAGAWWAALEAIVTDLAPRNRELLAKRDALQDQIDQYHRKNGVPADLDAYKSFLKEIGVVFAGVDMINEKISEVNITSPTGFLTYQAIGGRRLAPAYLDYAETLI